MLKLRIFSALILIPLSLFLVWKLPPFYFQILSGILWLFIAHEWARLLPNYNRCMLAIFIGLLLAFGGLFFYGKISAFFLIFGALAWAFALYQVLVYQINQRALVVQPWCQWLAAGFILSSSWFALVGMHQGPHGPLWVTMTLILTWSVDIGAFFSGRQFGGALLISKVSPKKTWAGAWGALAVVGIVVFLINYFVSVWVASVFLSAFFALTVTCAAIFGDLYESVIKRMAGVKDSGHLIPGHGGLLDRLDSLFATLPVVFVFIFYIGG